jgi:transposase
MLLENQNLCRDHDVVVLYLSSYSSDYNFIEELFSIIKKWLKKHWKKAKLSEFKNFLRHAMKACSNEQFAERHFRHASIQTE